MARSKRVTTPRALGGLGSLITVKCVPKATPDLKNGGRGRAQWPGRKLPPANTNPPYVWIEGKKQAIQDPFFPCFIRVMTIKLRNRGFRGGFGAGKSRFSGYTTYVV